jgi:hypothetical protein
MKFRLAAKISVHIYNPPLTVEKIVSGQMKQQIFFTVIQMVRPKIKSIFDLPNLEIIFDIGYN